MASSGDAVPTTIQISNTTQDHDPQVSLKVVEKVPLIYSNGKGTAPESVLLAQKPSLPEIILDWGVKILGLAAAVVFGVWAPISYKATADGNNSSDSASYQASTAMASLNSIAATASYEASTAMISLNSIAVAASSQASAALDALNSRIVAIGQLWLYDFCAG